jgi:hypothetical protein
VSAERLRAGEWQVLAIPEHSEAAAFIGSGHYARGAPNTSTYRHGLYRAGFFRGDLFGVALWIPPTKVAALTVDENWQGVLSLSRFVVAEGVPANAASFLLGASMRAVSRRRWPTFLTYADTAQGHTGTIYYATNWRCLGPVPAGDTWRTPDGRQMGRKRGGHTYTAAEMAAAGFVRCPGLPKIKFVHWTRRSMAPAGVAA